MHIEGTPRLVFITGSAGKAQREKIIVITEKQRTF
jgi:hypothetical protein